MASSTADIAATAVATAHHLGHLLDEPTLARLCVALEPTDSTLFRQLTLFDHNTAATQIACPSAGARPVSAGEPADAAHHRLSPAAARAGLLANASRLQLAWEKYSRPATAATRSCWAKQRPSAPLPASSCCLSRGLTRCWTVESAGLYGLNVAHSGSVVGLLLDRRRHDVEFLQWRLADSDIAAHWPQQHLLAMVPGGVILQ